MKLVKALYVLPIFMIVLTLFVPFGQSVTWSIDFRLTTVRSFDGLPSIAQTIDGKIWVVWETDIMGNTDIAYQTYNGSKWSEYRLLVNDTGGDISPSILQAANGTIWLFWSSNRNGNYDIYCKTSSDNGTTWASETPLITDVKDDNVPAVAETSDGTIWLVWQRRFPGPSYDLFYDTYDGASWAGENQLAFGSYERMPSVTQMADGRIWVTWCSYRVAEWQIYCNSYDGASWAGENQLTFSSNVDVDPAIIQARDGTIYIVWTSAKPTTNAQDDLYYVTSSDNGDNWSDPEQLTKDSSDDCWSSIAQMNDKKLWVAWTSNRYDNYDIYHKNSDEIVIHDVATTEITPSKTLVAQGESLSIDVVAENQGDEAETFTVECYANSTLLGSEIVSLANQSSTTVTFPWDTSSFSPGPYVMSANASAVAGENEVNLDDNRLTDGTVNVAVHDVSVVDVSPSEASVGQGYDLKIDVQVRNEGGFSETFNVTAYRDSVTIETKKVTGLDPYTSRVLTFVWDTTGVPYGNYVVSATAEIVPDEIDPTDNSQTDGTILVKIPGDVDTDGDVDIADLSWIARAWGTTPAWPHGTDWHQWNPECDINNDLKVDAYDLSIASGHFGETATY
jgi:hypothetical protein